MNDYGVSWYSIAGFVIGVIIHRLWNYYYDKYQDKKYADILKRVKE